MAPGGHSIRLSCCCNKSLLFATRVVCVCVVCPAVRQGARRPDRRCAGRAEPAGARGRSQGRQVRAAPRRAPTDGMRCRRLCAFGNFRPLRPCFPPRAHPGPALGPVADLGWPPAPQPAQRAPRLCLADAARGPRRLMRVGLALILVGHVNLLLGAVLHGTVLRHVANPRGAVTPEYTTANVISVGSGLLVSAAGRGEPGQGRGRWGPPSGAGLRFRFFQSVSLGLVALLASRNLFRPRLVRFLEL